MVCTDIHSLPGGNVCREAEIKHPASVQHLIKDVLQSEGKGPDGCEQVEGPIQQDPAAQAQESVLIQQDLQLILQKSPAIVLPEQGQRFPASSVLAREGAGCGSVGDVPGAWLASAPLWPSLGT